MRRVVTLAWGNKVSQEFRDRAVWVADQLNIDPSYLMSAMAFESGESFRSDKRNGAGSGAVGLIQFMPATARALKTTTASLAAMTPEDQLKYVYYYLKPFSGKMRTISDLYMAILWPKAVGKPEAHILWHRRDKPVTYQQNAGLDTNKDGVITKGEAAAKVYAKLVRGLSTPFLWRGFVNP